MKIQYIPGKRFHPKTQVTITRANLILEEYEEKGFDLTLRQLYYQFVAKGWMVNKQSNYMNLSSIITNARLAGLVSWESIVDRTRRPIENSHWENPREIIDACIDGYQLDKRSTQPNYIEVWVEKEALVGVVRQACEPLDILCFACKGYVSSSAMWRAAGRIKIRAIDRPAWILHLGDHDPSGIQMTNDIETRLKLLSWNYNIEVTRIALNMDQIERLNPPPNPAKQTDPRFAEYREEYGEESWELDALPPETITKLIQGAIRILTNQRKFNKRKKEEKEHKQQLEELAENL